MVTDIAVVALASLVLPGARVLGGQVAGWVRWRSPASRTRGPGPWHLEGFLDLLSTAVTLDRGSCG